MTAHERKLRYQLKYFKQKSDILDSEFYDTLPSSNLQDCSERRELKNKTLLRLSSCNVIQEVEVEQKGRFMFLQEGSR